MATILDHLAVGTPTLSDGWELFGGVLGGTWAYGGDSPGFWWGQLEFAAGPKIELLTPTGGPDAAFLERFLAARGAGPHHFNFLVTNIEERAGPDQGLRYRAGRGQHGESGVEGGVPAPAHRARDRHPGRSAGRFADVRPAAGTAGRDPRAAWT